MRIFFAFWRFDVTMNEENQGFCVSIAEKLTDDMKSSMLARDATRTGTLRLLRGSLKNEEIKIGHPLDEAEALKVLQREAKQRRDSIDAYTTAGREDLAANEQGELDIISSYLPSELSDAELDAVVSRIVADMGTVDMRQMGQVIGRVMQKVGAQADGGRVAKVVREKLG